MAAPLTREDIEQEVLNIQQRRQGLKEAPVEKGDARIGLGAEGHFDTDIYSAKENRFSGYVTSIAATEEQEDDDDYSTSALPKKSSYTAPLNFLNDTANDKDYDPLGDRKVSRISDREDEYRAQRRKMIISPERADPFADARS